MDSLYLIVSLYVINTFKNTFKAINKSMSQPLEHLERRACRARGQDCWADHSWPCSAMARTVASTTWSQCRLCSDQEQLGPYTCFILFYESCKRFI